MKRILIRSHGPDEQTVKLAFQVAAATAKGSGVKFIHLIVPAKSSFSSTAVAKFLGEKATNSLLKGEAVPISNGPHVKLDSAVTVRRSQEPKIALAAYLGGKDLREVDMLPAVQAIIYLPWHAEEGEGWQQSWNAEVHGEAMKEDDLKLDPELEAQLQSLTNSINLSTGFSHPSDAKTAMQMFKILKENGIPFEAKKLRSWALRKGWRPDFAEDLYELAVSKGG